MAGFLVFIMAIVALGAGLLGWNLTPKGMNQTSVDRFQAGQFMSTDHGPFNLDRSDKLTLLVSL